MACGAQRQKSWVGCLMTYKNACTNGQDGQNQSHPNLNYKKEKLRLD